MGYEYKPRSKSTYRYKGSLVDGGKGTYSGPSRDVYNPADRANGRPDAGAPYVPRKGGLYRYQPIKRPSFFGHPAPTREWDPTAAAWTNPEAPHMSWPAPQISPQGLMPRLNHIMKYFRTPGRARPLAFMESRIGSEAYAALERGMPAGTIDAILDEYEAQHPELGEPVAPALSSALGGGAATTARGVPSSQGRGAPERFEADVMGGIQTAAMAPGHALERPLAVGNAAARFVTGTPQNEEGPLDHILQGIGDIGIGDANIGNALGLVGEGIGHVGNAPMALLNLHDADRLAYYGNQRDDTVMSGPLGKKTDGGFLGFLGIGGRDMTVGEFKEELGRRGWNQQVDEAGNVIELPWEEVAAKAKVDRLGFGDKAINDSIFVELGARVALDPFNILLGAGVLGKAAKFAKWATNPVMTRAGSASTALGSGLRPTWGTGYAASMVKEGVRLAQLPGPALSARAIGAGQMSAATLRGLGHVFAAPRAFLLPGTGSLARRYARGAIRTEIALLGVEFGSGAIDSAATATLGEDNIVSGFMEPLHDASQALLADKPMSQDVTFMMISAFAMPAVPLIREDAGALSARARQSFGDQDLFLWGREYGADTSGLQGIQDPLGRGRGKARQNELLGRLGGKQEFARLIDHIDMRMAFDRLKDYTPIVRHFASFDEAMARSKAIGHTVAAEARRMRDANQITPQARMEAFKDWGRSHKRTVVDRNGNVLREVPQRVDFELSNDALIDQWVRYREVHKQIEERFTPIGEAILGRASRLTQEDLRFVRGTIAHAVKGGRVNAAFVRDLLSQAPAMFEDGMLSQKQREFWTTTMNLGVGAKGGRGIRPKGDRGTFDASELDAELAALEQMAPPAPELYHEAAKAERRAAGEPPRATGGIVRNGALRKIYTAKKLRELRVESNAEVRSLTKQISLTRTAFERKWTKAGALRPTGRRVVRLASGETPPRATSAPTPEMAALRAEELGALHTMESKARDLRRNVKDINDRATELRSVIVDPSFLDENGNPSVSPDSMAAIREQTAFVHENFPRLYGVEKAPKVSYARYQPEDSHLAALLTERSNLAQVLFDYGPIAKATQFVSWLTSPVKSSQMAHDSRQQVYNILLPLKAKSDEVTNFLNALRDEQSKGYTIGKIQNPVFRGVTSVLPNRLHVLAREAFGANDGFLKAFEQKYGGLDRMHNALDEAHNSFVRRVDLKVFRGEKVGRLEKVLRSGYWAWQNLPGLRTVSDTTRLASKVFYPLFRFQMDIRWHALNQVEADTLAFFRDGIDGTRFSRRRDSIVRRGGKDVNLTQNAVDHHGAQSGVPSVGKKGGPGNEAAYEDTGIFLTNQNLAPVLKRSFQKQSLENVDAAINDFAATDPILQLLQRKYGTEEGTWADQLNETLYSFDKHGVRNSIDEAVRKVRKYEKWSQSEYDQMVPFISKLVERNQRTFDDLVNIHVGNINRSRLERTMNSFWLYWPISYQIKAAKWMTGLLTQRSFGQQTNLGGAFTLDRAAQRVREIIETTPDFQQQMEDNEDWWFAASMLLPMTPWDAGVSLNRVVRYTGGNVLGLWPEYEGLEDPGDYASKMFEMGPIYSVDLFNRLFSEKSEPQAAKGPSLTSLAP